MEPLSEVLAIMRARRLGNAIDPGPTAEAVSRPLFELLATEGWPVICQPRHNRQQQIKGGDIALRDEDVAAMAVLDDAGLFTAIQLGEWGYHFHQLASDEGWWRQALGADFERFEPAPVKPRANRGYDSIPTTRQACRDELRDYFRWHLDARRGRLISVTGHSHYEILAPEWGATVVGIELGENILYTQSKIAFARGAARRWGRPWTAQVSPWFGPAVTTAGPLDTSEAIATGLDAGHSLSLCRRLWLHSWFAGAAMVTPENSFRIYFDTSSETGTDAWTLTPYADAAADAFRFMQDHDRGEPYTPLLVVLDELAGYCGFEGLTWGVLPPTAGDLEIRDLLEVQLFDSPRRVPVPGDPVNPEAVYLKPTPFGECCDAMLSTAPGETMAGYPAILLAGEMAFPPEIVASLEIALHAGSRVLLHPRHADALGLAAMTRLQAAGEVEVLAPGVHPRTGRPSAIDDDRLQRLADDLLPIALDGDPIQFQINRNDRGWVIELVNNAGVVKEGRSPAIVHPEAIARVRLTPRFEWRDAEEWMTGDSWTATPSPEDSGPTSIEVIVPPGESRFIELVAAVERTTRPPR